MHCVLSDTTAVLSSCSTVYNIINHPAMSKPVGWYQKAVNIVKYP